MRPSSDVAYLSRALKAPRVREVAFRLADVAREEGWDYEAYLAAVLAEEVAGRESHGGAARVRRRGFALREFPSAIPPPRADGPEAAGHAERIPPPPSRRRRGPMSPIWRFAGAPKMLRWGHPWTKFRSPRAVVRAGGHGPARSRAGGSGTGTAPI